MRKLGLLTIAIWVALANEAHSSEREWLTQQSKTRHFSFEVGAVKDGEDGYTAKAFRVIERRTGKVLQEEAVDSTVSVRDPGRLLELMDVNFDGWPDLTLPNADGGAGPNYTRNFYLYDKDAKLFVYHPQLSELSQPVVGKNRTIIASSRGGCCQHSTETYRFVQGKLVLIAEWDESYTAEDDWVVTTTRVLRNGRWHDKISRRPAPNSKP